MLYTVAPMKLTFHTFYQKTMHACLPIWLSCYPIWLIHCYAVLIHRIQSGELVLDTVDNPPYPIWLIQSGCHVKYRMNSTVSSVPGWHVYNMGVYNFQRV